MMMIHKMKKKPTVLLFYFYISIFRDKQPTCRLHNFTNLAIAWRENQPLTEYQLGLTTPSDSSYIISRVESL